MQVYKNEDSTNKFLRSKFSSWSLPRSDPLIGKSCQNFPTWFVTSFLPHVWGNPMYGVWTYTIHKTFWMVVPGCPLPAQGPEECHGSTRCEVQLQQNIGGFGCRTHAAHGKFILKPPLNDKRTWRETQRCFKKGSNITQKGFFHTISLDT